MVHIPDDKDWAAKAKDKLEAPLNPEGKREIPLKMPIERSVLQEAQMIIHGDRRQQYGHPKVNFERIAKLWQNTLEVDSISAEQVALCLIQLKVARLINNIDRDGMVDVAGYIGCLAMIVDEDEA